MQCIAKAVVGNRSIKKSDSGWFFYYKEATKSGVFQRLPPLPTFSSRIKWCCNKETPKYQKGFYVKILCHILCQKVGGAQVVFSSVLPVGDWDPGRKTRIRWVNDWLQGWFHAKGFGFYDLGCTFEGLGMLMPDEAHLTRWGKSVLDNKLAGLVRRALNYLQWGKGMHLRVKKAYLRTLSL